MKRIISKSDKETRRLGKRLWGAHKKHLGKKAVVFALEGELGAGKTQLVKGLAKEMGIKEDVISPTFTLEAEYGLGKLVHIDAWRLEDPQELLEIGFEKRVEEKKVIVIEWADKVRGVLQNNIDDRSCKLVWVKMKYPDLKSRTGGKGENERIIEIKEI
jgi:tRNA threonylcarbamoyl adenosine modification protein YjeE